MEMCCDRPTEDTTMRFSIGRLIKLTSIAGVCVYLVSNIVAQQPGSTSNPKLTIQFGHSNKINDAVFSPDGKLIASAGAEGVAILWDSYSRRELRRFTGHEGEISCLAFSPSGKYLVTGGGQVAAHNAVVGNQKDFTLRLWDVATGNQLKRFSGHSKPVTSVAFAPNDENIVITSSEDGTVRSWNVRTGVQRQVWKGTDPVNVTRFSPDGKMIAVASGSLGPRTETRRASPRFAIRLVSVTTLRLARSLVGHTDPVGNITFSPDGKTLVSTTLLPYTEAFIGTTEARAWDVATGRSIQKLGAFFGRAAFLSDGQVLAIGCERDFDYGVCLFEKSANGSFSAAGTRVIGIPTDTSQNDFSRDGVVTVVETNGSRLVYVRSPIESGGSAGYVTGRSEIYIHDISLGEVGTLAGVSEPFRNFDAESASGLNHFERVKFANDNVSFLSGRMVWNIDNSQVLDLSELFQPANATAPTGGETEQDADDPGEEAIVVSNSGRYVVISDSRSVRLIELATRRTIADLPGFEFARFTDDDARLMILSEEKAYVFDTAGGKELFSTETTQPSRPPAGSSWTGFTPNNSDLTITPDGKYIFFRQEEKLTRVNLQTQEASDLDLPVASIPFIAATPDSRHIALEQDFVVFLDTETGARRSVFNQFSKAPYGTGATFRFATLKISPDSRVALIAGDILPPERVSKPEIPTLKMMDISTGRELWFANEQDLQASAFSPDNRLFGTVSSDQKTLTIRSRESFEVVRTIAVADAFIQQITFSPNSKLILVKTEDGATRIFNIQNGRELCRLLSLSSGNWLTVKVDDGRFDTGDLDNIDGVYWMMNDRPFEPFSMEVFMRQYYEPGLLHRVLKCNDENNCEKEFKPLPSIGEINRIQPRLSMPKADMPPREDLTIDVTVEVESVEEASTGDTDATRKEPRRSGVYDLRLFRDGQLVATSTPKERAEQYIKDAPANVAAARPTDKVMDSPEDRSWRLANDIFTIRSDNVKIISPTKAEVTFRNIRLRRDDRDSIEFTAYAFNADRVKSETVRMTYKLAKRPKREGNVYLITIGVNKSEVDAFDLKYAANDARKMQEILGERLDAKLNGTTGRLIRVPLISDIKDGKAELTATKPIIKAVFELLAGDRSLVSPELLAQIPNADKIRAVEPEDTIVISFSGHGYADRNGIFYLLPYDVGKDTIRLTPQAMERLISSDELSLWMRDVTAKEMIMIVDACYSAAAVQGEGFKPGPMGSRGLGQLAYDKGMKILSATQANNVALELKSLEHGLLSYALLEDGIKLGKADMSEPNDKKLTTNEWLSYGVKGVPRLYRDVIDGKRKIVVNGRAVIFSELDAESRATALCIGGKSCGKYKNLQQPSLFDFRRARPETDFITLN